MPVQPLEGEHAARLRCVNEQMDLSVCNGCGECRLRCATGVQMSRLEYDAIQRFESESLDRDSIAKVRRQDKSVDLGDGVSVTMCRYYDMPSGRCAVYPARPLVCRLLGHVEWMPCPIDKVEKVVSTPDALALMESYSRYSRKTFEEWDAAADA